MVAASTIPRLSRYTDVNERLVEAPPVTRPNLPERILQFGTGAFLRGFCDAFIDEAIRKDEFDGRIVAIGSTGSGRPRAMNEQDGRFTVCVRGLDGANKIDRCRIVGSVSRAIAAGESWEDVLALGRSPDLRYVISNTTETGIRDDPADHPAMLPPHSFPGKLTALLAERAAAFGYDPACGLIVLCCELVEHNGDRLREIVLRMADRWALGDSFTEWIRVACKFCNTLVDRIVTEPAGEDVAALESRLGYHDALLVQTEPHALWAIEGDEKLQGELPFCRANPEIIVARDISPFWIRKIRILNGTHTILAPIAYLNGNDTVGQAMRDPRLSNFVDGVVFDEIVPSLPLPRDGASEAFADRVLERFSNPFVRHTLLNIALQETRKMNVRVVPSLVDYARVRDELPRYLTLGFAAFLVFVLRRGRAAGTALPPDEGADRIRTHWFAAGELDDFVRAVASDESLWSHSLVGIPGFVETVSRYLAAMLDDGVPSVLESFALALDRGAKFSQEQVG